MRKITVDPFAEGALLYAVYAECKNYERKSQRARALEKIEALPNEAQEKPSDSKRNERFERWRSAVVPHDRRAKFPFAGSHRSVTTRCFGH